MSRRRQTRHLSAPVLGASTAPRRTVGTDPSLRTMTLVTMRASTQRKSRAGKMTRAQRNSEGRRSEWAMSPTFWTDAKWSATVSSL